MLKMRVLPILLFAVSQAGAMEFNSLQSMGPDGVKKTAEKIIVAEPSAPANISKPDAQLLNKFDSLKRDLATLRIKADDTRSEMFRLQAEAARISRTGASYLSFQSDMMRLSTDLTRYINDERNMVYAVTNILPLALKDRELNLRALDMDASAAGMQTVSGAADLLEQTVCGIQPAVIGYSAALRAREITRQADELTDYAEQVREKTLELVKATKPGI